MRSVRNRASIREAILPTPMSQFCLRCATPLEDRVVDHRARPTCPSCGYTLFFDPKVAVAALLKLGEGIVLCKRAIDPGMGKWSFPAGFVDRGEEIRSALVREIREETGLDAVLGPLVGVYSDAGNPVVLIVYEAEAEGIPMRSDESSAIDVFDPGDLPDLAFAHDRLIVDDWLNQT